MKNPGVLIAATLLSVIISCSEIEPVLEQGIGKVIDLSGSGSCGMVIELDNGKMIQPTFYPDNFVFADGQRVEISYLYLKNLVSGCEKGSPCEIHSIRQIGCKPYVNLTALNYDSLQSDPVQVQDAYIDGDCLHIKISYSGGCRLHTVDLARIYPKCGTPPLPPPTFEIRHNSNGDMCEAFITKDYRFDISLLKKEGEHQFVLNAKLPGGQVYSKTFNLP
jgi:hypothetical protein